MPETTVNRIDEEAQKRGGAEGGRFTGGTEDSGPRKPGNSVEEKTLTTRRRGAQQGVLGKEPAACGGQHTAAPKASSWIPCEPGGSKIVVGVWEAVDERRWWRRGRAVGVLRKQGNQQTGRGYPNPPSAHTDQSGGWKVSRDQVLGRGPPAIRPSRTEGAVTEEPRETTTRAGTCL